MARASKTKIAAQEGIQIGTSSTSGHVFTATDSSGNGAFQAKPSYTFHTQSSFAVAGAVAAADVIPTFFVAEASSGQATTLAKARYKVGVGTNVTFRLLKNGSEFGYGTTGSPLTATTSAATTTSSQALAEDDEIELDIIGISGTPSRLTVTLVFEHVIS